MQRTKQHGTMGDTPARETSELQMIKAIYEKTYGKDLEFRRRIESDQHALQEETSRSEREIQDLLRAAKGGIIYCKKLLLQSHTNLSHDWRVFKEPTFRTWNIKGELIRQAILTLELAGEPNRIDERMFCRSPWDLARSISSTNLSAALFWVEKRRYPECCFDKICAHGGNQHEKWDNEWKSSHHVDNLSQLLESNKRHLRNVDDIFCFGNALGCFGTESCQIAPSAHAYMLVKLVSLIYKHVFRSHNPDKTIMKWPRLFLIGCRICDDCEREFTDRIWDGLRPTDGTHLQLQQNRYLTQSDRAFVDYFGPGSLIVAFDTMQPVLPIVGDLAKTEGDPVAIIAPSIPVSSKQEQMKRYGGVLTPNALDLLQRYDASEVQDPQGGAAAQEWESSVFSQPPLTLYTKRKPTAGLE